MGYAMWMMVSIAYWKPWPMGEQPPLEGLTWESLVVEPLTRFAAHFLRFIPDLLVALCILFFGWIVAKIMQLIVSVFLRSIGFDSFAKKIGIAELIAGGDTDVLPHRWFGLLAFWVTISMSLVMILDRLRLRIASAQLDQLLSFFFTILSSLVILALGIILSFIASKIVGTIARNLKMEHASTLEGVTQWSVIVFAFFACLMHIGMPVQILLIAIGIAYVSVCIVFVISFGMGGIVWAGKFLDRTFTKNKS